MAILTVSTHGQDARATGNRLTAL